MAAAEYYTATPGQPWTQNQAYQQSPYQQPPYQHPSPSQGSPMNQSPRPQHVTPQAQQYPPPPYQPLQQEHKLSVHFAPTPQPSEQPHRPPVSSHNDRPSPPGSSNQGQYLQPPSQIPPHGPSGSFSGQPPAGHSPYLHPFAAANPSEYALDGGYASDPEHRRRRRRSHSSQEDRDLHESTREAGRPKKHRSRSSNADGLIGAAGGGLIGDLIFPGLGTVGGALAGWIGGKDYGKHRKHREEKLSREQEEWEQRFGHGRNSHEGRSRHHSDSGHRPHRGHHSDY